MAAIIPIIELLLVDKSLPACVKLRKIAPGFDLGRLQAQVAVVAAFDALGAEDRAFVREDTLAGIAHLAKDGFVVRIADEQIKTGLAAHRSEINNLIVQNAVADIGGEHVLQGMERGVVDQIVRVRPAMTHVIGRDVSVHAADVQPREQFVVVDGKAGDPGNMFHKGETS